MWLERRTHVAASIATTTSASSNYPLAATQRRPHPSLVPQSSTHRAARSWHSRLGHATAEAAPRTPTTEASLSAEDVALERWRAAALAQAQLIVQLVRQQRQMQRIQGHLLLLVTQYQHTTHTARALGLDARERWLFRLHHPSLCAAAEALDGARRAFQHGTGDDQPPLSVPVTFISPRDVAALFQEEATGLASSLVHSGSSTVSAVKEPFFLLTALFDAVLLLNASPQETAAHAPTCAPCATGTGALKTVDTGAARRCFDWLLQHHSPCALPRDVYVSLWARVVSARCAKPALPSQPHQETSPPPAAPDVEAAHWELSSMKTLAQLFPLTDAHAHAHVALPGVVPALPLSISLSWEASEDVGRQAHDLARQWRALQRLDTLQPPPALSMDHTPREAAAQRRLDDVGFRARCLQQRLFFPSAARSGSGTEGLALDVQCRLFSEGVVQTLAPYAEASPSPALPTLSPEWCDTVLETTCAWAEAEQRRTGLPPGPVSALLTGHATSSSSWYVTDDLFLLKDAEAQTRAATVPPGQSSLVTVLLGLTSASAALAPHLVLSSPSLARFVRAVAALCASLPDETAAALADGCYHLVWCTVQAHPRSDNDVHHRLADEVPLALSVALLRTLFGVPQPCRTRAQLYRRLWAFGCVLHTSHDAESEAELATVYLPSVLECVAASSLPQSEKAVMALAVTRQAAARGLAVSAYTHVAMQRCLLLGAASGSDAVASPTRTTTSAPPTRRPSWLRRQARWSSAEAWCTSACRHAQPLCDDDKEGLLLVQSSLRCSLAMGAVEEATVLAAQLPSVDTVSRRTGFTTRLAALHVLLFFCTLDATHASREAATQIARLLLREAPAVLKDAHRAQWRQWYRRAVPAATVPLSHPCTSNGATASVASFDAAQTAPVGLGHARTASPAPIVSALLRDPFGRGLHLTAAWPAALWQRAEASTDTAHDTPLHVNLGALDRLARARAEQEADLAFAVDSDDVRRVSHWQQLCTSPLRRATTAEAESSVQPPHAPPASTTDASTAVKTRFLAATAAIRHHPRGA